MTSGEGYELCAAKFQTLVVCSIEDFLLAPVARAFGPAVVDTR